MGNSVDLAALFERLYGLGASRAERLVESVLSRSSLIALGGMAVVLALEVLAMGYGQSSLRRLVRPSKEGLADLFYFGGKLLGYYGLVVGVFSLGLSVAVGRLAERHFGIDLLSRVEHPAVAVPLFLLATDFVAYWTHRARHGFAWWWELHKYHHAAEEFNALTTARKHPLDAAAISVTNAIPVAVLGGTIEHYVAVQAILAVHAGLSHSMLDWRWGWFGKYVILSPVYHRVHHSPLPEHVDKNFAALFPVWDWLFGTLYRGAVVNPRTGVDDNCFRGKGLFASMGLGVANAWRVVARRPAPAPARPPVAGASP